MEAALRTAADTILNKPLDQVDYKEVRGTEGIKEAEYDIGGLKIKVAVASGLSNAKKICEKVKNGEANYHFIEIMCCPGGCVNGGGQPIVSHFVRENNDIKAMRAKVLYEADKNLPKRKSHDNPVVKDAYDTFLGRPGSEKAHHLLHTKYIKRKKYKS